MMFFVEKMINYPGIGEEKSREYLSRHYEDVDMNNLTRGQAQKIIDKFVYRLPSPIISGVYGRDVGPGLS